jgi:hypothetical protein
LRVSDTEEDGGGELDGGDDVVAMVDAASLDADASEYVMVGVSHEASTRD